MRKIGVLLGLAVLAGCGSSGSNGASASGGPGQDGGIGGDGAASAACTPADLSEVGASISGSFALIDVASDGDGAWLLLRGTGSDQGRLEVMRPSGADTHVLDTNATAAAITTGADGKVCAAWGVMKTAQSPAGVHAACAPDFSVVDTKLTTVIDPSAPLAYRESATGGALLFEGDYASLSAITHVGSKWAEEEMYESSISYPGSAHALADATDGAPYCFIADQGSGPAPVVVKSWGRSGSANDWGSVSLDGSAAAESCSIAVAGGTVGVLVAGGAQIKFASAQADPSGYASVLVPEAFHAEGVVEADLAATSDGFVAVYSNGSGDAFVATRGASAGASFTSTQVALPAGGHAGHVKVTVGANGARHIFMQDTSSTRLPGIYYQRSCLGS